MTIQPEDQVVCNAKVLSAELALQTVLMSLDNGTYYGLSATSQDIWRALAQPVNVHQLCVQLSEKYQAPLAQVESDSLAFLDYLLARGLIQVVAAGA